LVKVSAEGEKGTVEPVTLIVAVIGSLGAFCLRPILGLIVYIAALAWYPTYLTLKVGTIDLSAARIVLIVLYANILFRTKLIKQFKWSWLDRLVIITLLGTVVAGLMNEPFWKIIENRSGAALDLVLPYFATRMIVTSRTKLFTLLKGILIVAAPLAILGAHQSVTGNNPLAFLQQYNAWYPGHEEADYVRYGFHRATLTFDHITFGLFFAMLAPCCAALCVSPKRWRVFIMLGLGLMIIGILSSVSSGPMLAALASLAMFAMFPARRYWPALLIILVAGCIFIEVFSNRHFYQVATGFTLSSETADYRIGLIEEAFGGGMTGHWIEGYGLVDIDPDTRIPWEHYDLANDYINILARYGLLGLVPYLMVIVFVCLRLRRSYVLAGNNRNDKWMVWCLLSALIGMLVTCFSVSLMGQTGMVFYILLGLCGSMPCIIHSTQPQLEPVQATSGTWMLPTYENP
jgi:hypothetical protein